MDTLTHKYENCSFEEVLKANFRKYIQDIYRGKNTVVEMFRKTELDKLVIYRVHRTIYFMKQFLTFERVEIDLKTKSYKSFIDSSLYKEECNIFPEENGVRYNQMFNIGFLMKHLKKSTFEKGCHIIEEIMSKSKRT